MSNVRYSPDDPLFPLHHTNVDKWFGLWQDLHYPNGITETELETAQFSGDLDDPMVFEFNGVTSSRSGQYFQPRQVLLLDDDNINVIYEEDDLAQILVQITSADETPYDPNVRSPQVWFTLPSQTTSSTSTSATETSTTVSSTTTPQPPSTTTELPATTTTASCTPKSGSCSETNNNCCSGNCKNDSCKGGVRERELLTSDISDVVDGARELANPWDAAKSQGQGPPSFANPKAQERWAELMAEGMQGKDAIRQIAIEECPPGNPVTCTKDWLAQTGMDIKYCRCYVE